MAFDDGTNGKYNIGKERAQLYWDKHKDYFKSLGKKDLLKKSLKNQFKTSMREKITSIKNA